MNFYKYQCLENDFIIVTNKINNIKDFCDQHKMVGADGLIYIDDNKIYFFNKDGSKAKMCGNGIRCAAKFLNENNKESNIFNFEGENYKITHNDDDYTLYSKFLNYKKFKNHYFVYSNVPHIILFEKYNHKKAIKLQNKYKSNITFCINNNVQTLELGVGMTRGCGTGLIAVMNILYLEKNIDNIELYSMGGKSHLRILNNEILLESKVYNVYKGEITC